MPISKIKSDGINDAAITTAKLADSAVNSAKIGVDVIAAEDLAANSVTVSEISNGAVTSAKLDTNIAIAGNLTVDTTTFHVDSANNRVGVGTASPSSLFDVDKSQDAETNIEITNTNAGSAAQVRTKYTTDGGLFTVGKTSDAHVFGGDAYIYNVDNTNIRFATNDTERMRIASNGYIGVNRTDLSYRFEVDSATMAGAARFHRYTDGTHRGLVYFRSSSNGSTVGEISINNSSTAYNTTSDYRLKENIADLTGAIDRVKQVPVHRFNFIADPDTTVDGFIAHEVADIVPEAITGEKDAVNDEGNPVYQGIDQSKLVPLLTAALQEAVAKIEALETRIAALESA